MRYKENRLLNVGKMISKYENEHTLKTLAHWRAGRRKGGLTKGVNAKAEERRRVGQEGQRVRKQEQNKSVIWNSESSHSGGINEK